MAPTVISDPDPDSKIYFDGSNWEDLLRMLGLARFAFLQDEDYDDNNPRRCAYVASRFRGPALDWVTTRHSLEPSLFENFELFVDRTREAFGVEDTNLTALRRSELEKLKWDPDAPVFFANFDRLTLQLRITDHGTKIAMLNPKLPLGIREKMADQALNFANYETMRERILTMWALDPSRTAKSSTAHKRPRCGKCGRKGHTASECNSKN